MPFGTKNPEWRGYPMVKIFYDMFIRFDMIHERDRHYKSSYYYYLHTDGRTDGQTDTA